MRIVEGKAKIIIDGEGNHVIENISPDQKEIETSENEDTGTILAWTNKVKEHNEKEIKMAKTILGKNSSGHIDYRLIVH